MQRFSLLTLGLCATALAWHSQTMVIAAAGIPQAIGATVEVEEEVYVFQNPKNGANPVWSIGSSVIARSGDQIFVSGMDTKEGVLPLDNVQCVVYARINSRWEIRTRAEGLTREPCPIATDDLYLWLSTNPRIGQRAEPRLERWRLAKIDGPPEIIRPRWNDSPKFDSHSYRGMGIDRTNRDLLLLNILGHDVQFWAYLDPTGQWSKAGKLPFPKTSDSTVLRLTYPAVALRGRAAYVLAAADLLEPNREWQEYFRKRKTSLFAFRHLYYTWTPDITRQPLSDWIELANREPAGEVWHQDTWMESGGTAHFLWVERAVDRRLKPLLASMPDEKVLWHGVVRDGKVISRDRLFEFDSTDYHPQGGIARFHVTPTGRLFAVFAVPGRSGTTNRLLEIYADGHHSAVVNLNLKWPLDFFSAAGPRNGATTSIYLDLLGMRYPVDEHPSVRYARIRID